MLPPKPKKNSFTKAPIQRGIILDTVNPSDYLNVNFTYNCEQCSFYDLPNNGCSMGHTTYPHLKKNQIKTYELTGRMAFCRNLEID